MLLELQRATHHAFSTHEYAFSAIVCEARQVSFELEFSRGRHAETFFGPVHFEFFSYHRPKASFDPESSLEPKVAKLRDYCERLRRPHGWMPLGRLVHDAQDESIRPRLVTAQLIVSDAIFDDIWRLSMLGRRYRVHIAVQSPRLDLVYDGLTTRWDLDKNLEVPVDELSASSSMREARQS